jgi:hypothetical protein
MAIDTTTQDHETARPDQFFAMWQRGEVSAHEARRVLCADLRLLDETLGTIAAERDALRAQIGQIVDQLGGKTSLPGIGRLELTAATVIVSYERRQLDALIIAAIVRRLIEHDAQRIRPSHGDVEALALVDERQGSYMLLYVGWSGNVRHHDIIIHVRVRAGKVWIEHDGSAEGFATALIAAGIPADDIVLAFHHPRKRPSTGFAEG